MIGFESVPLTPPLSSPEVFDDAQDGSVLLDRIPHVLFTTIPKCAGCEHMILDRFILKVLDRTWHSKCLKCHECGAPLAEKCYARSGHVFCKEDFFKRFGTRCAGCDQGIPPTQVVRRAQENVYHLQCFSCIMCSRQLNTGDEFYLMDDKKLVCKSDFESAKAKADQPNKRPRTTITAKQLETLKTAYNNSPKPARHIREQLSQDTGLDMRVVQVWFQNRRAKEKRLKKDAGRTRWGQYFRNIKGHRSKNDPNKEPKDGSDVDVTFNPAHSEMSSNDGYSTPVNLAMEGVSDHLPGHPLQGHPGSFIPGQNTPPYLPQTHSPPPGTPHHTSQIPGYPYSEGLTMYTQLGQGPPAPGHLASHVLSSSGPGSDLSNGSSNQGYPDFPPSPESWLSDMDNSTHGQPY